MREWIVFCEASEDFEVITTLADRVIQAQIPWTEDQLEVFRTWRGFEPGRPYTKWKDVKKLAKAQGIRAHPPAPSASGPSIKGEYLQAVKAIKLANKLRAHGVVLSRDTDGADRRSNYEAARDNSALSNDSVCLAIAHPELEAWLICGFT